MERERELVLSECGLMWPDYWSGTSGVGLFVYPDNETTVADLKTMIQDEIYSIWDHIQYIFEEAFPDDEMLDLAIKSAIENFFHGADLSYKPFANDEFPTDEDENEESLPCIFILELED